MSEPTVTVTLSPARARELAAAAKHGVFQVYGHHEQILEDADRLEVLADEAEKR